MSENGQIVPCHSVNAKQSDNSLPLSFRAQAKNLAEAKMRLTAGCFGKLNMTDLVGYIHFRMIPFSLVIQSEAKDLSKEPTLH